MENEDKDKSHQLNKGQNISLMNSSALPDNKAQSIVDKNNEGKKNNIKLLGKKLDNTRLIKKDDNNSIPKIVNIFINKNNAPIILKKKNEEDDKMFENKMFYKVNNKNIINYNSPSKNINVNKNNFINYTNNYLLSNLLCDVSEDKKVMVSELDVNISNSQPSTLQMEKNGAPPFSQNKAAEKQNTESSFRNQLESNILNILKMNLNQKSKHHIKTDILENCNNFKEKEEFNINNSYNDEKENKKTSPTKNIDINSDNYNRTKKELAKSNNKRKNKKFKKDSINKYSIHKVESKKAGLQKSPNINIHKIRSVISLKNQNILNKKLHNYMRTDNLVKKYKTIYDNPKNNTPLKSTKFLSKAEPKKPNNLSNKNIKSYFIYNYYDNKIVPGKRSQYFDTKEENRNNVLLINYPNNAPCECYSTNKKFQNTYIKYKSILNEIHQNLFNKSSVKDINLKKSNQPLSYRNDNNEISMFLSLEAKIGRKLSPEKEDLLIYRNFNNDNKIDINKRSCNKSIYKNIKKCKINMKTMNNLNKQKSEISFIERKIKIRKDKTSNKNNSCNLNEKTNNGLSDSIIKKCDGKKNNTIKRILGVDQINLETKKNITNINSGLKGINEEENDKIKIRHNTIIESKLKAKKTNTKNSTKKIIIKNDKSKNKNKNNICNIITFRNKFLYNNHVMKKQLSHSKDNNQKICNKNKNNYLNNNEIQYIFLNKANKNEKNKNSKKLYNNKKNSKSKAKLTKDPQDNNKNNDKIKIDININNNIQYIYIIKKNAKDDKNNSNVYTVK